MRISNTVKEKIRSWGIGNKNTVKDEEIENEIKFLESYPEPDSGLTRINIDVHQFFENYNRLHRGTGIWIGLRRDAEYDDIWNLNRD